MESRGITWVNILFRLPNYTTGSWLRLIGNLVQQARLLNHNNRNPKPASYTPDGHAAQKIYRILHEGPLEAK